MGKKHLIGIRLCQNRKVSPLWLIILTVSICVDGDSLESSMPPKYEAQNTHCNSLLYVKNDIRVNNACC